MIRVSPLLIKSDPSWGRYYYQEKKWLCKHFNVFHIEHVGPTAIPGMLACPVIDIVMELDTLEEIQTKQELLQSIGYHINGKSLFKKINHSKVKAIHVLAYKKNDPDALRKIYLRNYLQAFEEEVAILNGLQDVKKSEFLAALEIKALQWNCKIEKLYPTIEKNALFAASTLTGSLASDVATAKLGVNQVAILQGKGSLIYGTSLLSTKDLDQVCNNNRIHYWICPWDQPRNLALELERRGFYLKSIEEGMLVDVKTLPLCSKKLEIRIAASDLELNDFNRLQSLELDKHTQNMMDKNLLGNEDFNLFVGYFEKKAVTSLVLVKTEQLIGIYSVVTDPLERRKGYASELVIRAMKKACNSQTKFAFLQASSQNEKLYKAIGFRRFSSFYEYKFYL